MTKLRIGIIGSGEFVQSCHLPGLTANPRAEVLALCGSDYSRVRRLADRFAVPLVYTDYRDLISDSNIDAVTIATPNAFHADQTVAAFAAGKHVFCEKPLAVDIDQAKRMYDAAFSSARVHQVAFTFRYGFALRELRRRLRAGDIGDPYYLRIQYDSWSGLLPDWRLGWRENQRLAGGGVLFDLGSHLFDAVRFVAGGIETITGFVHNIGRDRQDCRTAELTPVTTDDIAAAWFRHANGVRGQWFISRATPGFGENGWLEVIGAEGALKASLSRGSVDRLKISRPAQPDWQPVALPDEANDGQPHSLGRMMDSFVEACLRGHIDYDTDASFADGLAVQQAVAAVLIANENFSWITLDDKIYNREAGFVE